MIIGSCISPVKLNKCVLSFTIYKKLLLTEHSIRPDFFNSRHKRNKMHAGRFASRQSCATKLLNNSKTTRLRLVLVSFTSEDEWKGFPVPGQRQGDVVESKILGNKVNTVIIVYLRLIGMCPNLE